MLAIGPPPPPPPAPRTPGTALVPRTQSVLGDCEDAEERRVMLQEEASDKLAAFGPAGLVKPKDVLVFTRNLKLKVVGGQQLECECMFCHTRITSTGASRVVAHFSKDCVLCPPSVKDPCAAMRSHMESNRKGKVEHNTLVRAEQDLALTAIKAQKREQRQQSFAQGSSQLRQPRLMMLSLISFLLMG